MKYTTWAPIKEYLAHHPQATIHDMTKALGKGSVILHRHLKEALALGRVTKYGKVPRVFYRLAARDTPLTDLTYQQQQFLEEHFLSYTVTWQELAGAHWFVGRCQERSLKPEEQYDYFSALIRTIDAQRDNCGLIHAGYEKFITQVKTPFLDDLIYCDVYQLGHFGKSKLAQWAYYGKLTQSADLLQKVIDTTRSRIHCHLAQHHYDAVCRVPHSLSRPIQILDRLRKWRNLWLPEITLRKLYQDIITPQKSIKGTENRIRNARETIFANVHQEGYGHVLLIDDFIGSGASLNESAKKLIDNGLTQTVTGLVLVWNLDLTYEVLSEM